MDKAIVRPVMRNGEESCADIIKTDGSENWDRHIEVSMWNRIRMYGQTTTCHGIAYVTDILEFIKTRRQNGLICNLGIRSEIN